MSRFNDNSGDITVKLLSVGLKAGKDVRYLSQGLKLKDKVEYGLLILTVKLNLTPAKMNTKGTLKTGKTADIFYSLLWREVLHLLISVPSADVIHTVGPIAQGGVGEVQKKALRSCYKNSLQTATTNGARSVVSAQG